MAQRPEHCEHWSGSIWRAFERAVMHRGGEANSIQSGRFYRTTRTREKRKKLHMFSKCVLEKKGEDIRENS